MLLAKSVGTKHKMRPFRIYVFIRSNNGYKITGKKRSIDPVCGKEEYAPEGEPLYKIVESQADSNEVMMTDFVPAFEKMIENGYDSESELHVAPTNSWFGYYTMEGK